MSGFTKKPWVYSKENSRVVAVGGNQIAKVWQFGKGEGTANAHLITAAPELYEACAEFCRKVEAGEAKSTKSYQQMCSALAKARGDQ